MPKKKTPNSDSQLLLSHFGNKVRDARLKKKWTLEDAEANGWPSWQHLQQIETGQKNINLSTLVKLIDILDANPKELLEGLSRYL